MKLENVRIQRYRSAEDVQLAEIGNLNVLIGKNNSGKSTVLSSIDIFFRCIQGGRIVSLSPPAGKIIDFCQQQTAEPILITLAFSLLLAERDAVVRDIATEAPQLKNAVDGLDPSLWLEASLAITAEPTNYSYLKSLIFVEAGMPRASAAKKSSARRWSQGGLRTDEQAANDTGR